LGMDRRKRDAMSKSHGLQALGREVAVQVATKDDPEYIRGLTRTVYDWLLDTGIGPRSSAAMLVRDWWGVSRSLLAVRVGLGLFLLTVSIPDTH